jgi:uncharacterized membrane protein YraQ (UPF0718 family)
MNETIIKIDEPQPQTSCCAAAQAKPDDTIVQKTIVALRNNMAWTVAGVAFILLSVLDTPQAPESLGFVVRNLIEIAPFLALAIGLAAYAKASGADSLIAHVFSGNLGIMIFFAALFGGLSPFCSCGVIPLIAALLSMGVPLPAVMAFWLASPVMDPSMFVLTAATLGTPFAIGKTMAAVGIGLLGGYVTWALQHNGWLANPLRDGVGNGGCGASAVRNPKAVVWQFWSEEKRVHTFGKEALSSTLFLGKWLSIAFFIESLMLAYVPGEVIAGALGTGSVWAIPSAVIVGIPAYLNGYAALPLVDGLLDMGVSPGAGMAFLVSGGITSIPAAIAVFALVKRPVFVLYIALALTGGTLAGVGYQLFVV